MSSAGNDVRGLAGWLPPGQKQLESWLAGHGERVGGREGQELRPSVAAFKDLIDSDPVVGMLVRRMIEQVPQTRAYRDRHIRDVDHLLALIDGVLDLAPEYGQENVTLPMGAVLDWTMGTPAGFAAYPDQRRAQSDPARVVRVLEHARLAVRAQRVAAGLEVCEGPR